MTAAASDAELTRALARLGHATFRPGQREAIEALFTHRRALLVAPTGGGKSLCYQLPSLILDGTTLVISPLIALMADQVAGLQARGIAATYLASTLEAGEAAERQRGLAEGRYRIVYVAPERLSATGFRAALARVKVPLVAIDEAHCISEWGHDFRPDYLHIGAFAAELDPPYLLACTATATPVVRDEIVARLGMPPDTPQLVRGFARPNLSLRAVEVASAAARRTQTDRALAEALGSPGAARGTAIVYCGTRRATEAEAQRLGRLGWRTAAYHAGMSGADREFAQQQFIDGRLQVVCATNAFGMGIDRADVRAVVHLSPPGSIEAYYQEVGRAGRDGEDAIGLMCWQQADLAKRRRLLELSGDGAAAAPDILEHKWNLFLELIRWAEGGSCRHDAILRYFGDEAETLHGCGRCDVCLSVDGSPAPDTEQATELARKLLSGVARLKGRFGLRQAVRLLHGEAEERLESAGLTRTPTFGLLADRSPDWITRALGRCVTAGWVRFSADEYPVVFLTDDGIAVMRGERPARWLPPPDRPARGAGPARAAAPAEDALDPAEAELFEALRAERLRLAQQHGVPAYVIAHDRTLRELARLRPDTPGALAQVPGFGPKKAERYGEAFVEVITLASPPA